MNRETFYYFFIYYKYTLTMTDIKNIEYVKWLLEKYSKIKQYLEKIKKLTDFHLLREVQQLLIEATDLYDNAYFYWASWIIRVFNEKYIRETLVKHKFDVNKEKIPNKGYLQAISEIEEEFENSNIDSPEINALWEEIKQLDSFKRLNDTQKGKVSLIKNNNWSYNNMIKEMLDLEMINKEEYLKLKETYKNYRNCVQHWVYKRMYNQLQTDQYLFFEKQVKTPMLSTDFSKIANITIPGDSQLFRGMNLYESFHIMSQISFDVTYLLLSKFEKGFNTTS